MDIPETPANAPVKKRFALPKPVQIGMIIALVLSLGANAALGWWGKAAVDNKTSLSADKTKLQQQVGDLKSQLAAKTKVTPTPAPSTAVITPTPAPCSGRAAASAALKENAQAAISSRNTAALEGYMASSVNVVVAASEKGGFESPSQAVADLGYLNSATSPWNFSLSTATLGSWAAGSYAAYFSPTSYAGLAANKYVVSFDFNSCDKINQVFMSSSSDLLP